MTKNEFLSNLFVDRLGVSEDDFKTILEGDEIDDKFKKMVDDKLMTATEATTHKEVQKSIKSSVLQTIDGGIDEIMNELDLGDEAIQAIKKERNTFNRQKLLKKYMNEKLNNTKHATNEDAKKEIRLLNESLASLKTTSEQQTADLENQLKSRHKNLVLKYKLQNHDGWKGSAHEKDPDRYQYALAKINRYLEEGFDKKAQLNFNSSEELFNLVAYNSDDLEVFRKDNSKAGSFDDLVEMAMNEFRVKSPAGNGGQKGGEPPQKTVIPTRHSDSNGNKLKTGISRANDQLFSDLIS